MNEKFGSHGFPAKWQIKNLGEICNISTGKLNANTAVENGKYPFFTCSREIFSIDHFTFDCEAIFLAGNNAVGDFNVKHYKGKFNAYQRTYVITINKGESLLYKYLYLQMENALKGFKIKSVGASTKFLKLDMIRNLEIHIPPLPEQKQIVAILDEVFEGIDRAIANTENNLTNARELFDSSLQFIFSNKGKDWPRLKLLELLDLKWITSHLDGNHGGEYPRKDEFVSSGVPYISANCIKNERIDISLAKYLTLERASLLKKGVAQNNDVLFAHNATVGPVAILHTNEKEIILSTSLTYYRCDSSYIVPEYLALYMRSNEFKQRQFKTEVQHLEVFS